MSIIDKCELTYVQHAECTASFFVVDEHCTDTISGRKWLEEN